MSSETTDNKSPRNFSQRYVQRPLLSPEDSIDDEISLQFKDSKQEIFDAEEEKAQLENEKVELRKHKLAIKKRKLNQESRAEREAKAKQLDNLLVNCAKFSDILLKKTEVLGRVGSGFDEKTLGEHKLKLAKQPLCMIGGTMRDYQLEGLTWMFEICLQGMSGILADEMGLGKTIQTISLLAKFREDAKYMGPHLIVAPLSTLSNWYEEFRKWVPIIPVAIYHGSAPERKQIFEDLLLENLVGGRVNEKFPVVLSTPEIVMRDSSNLSKINWEILFIDEGHRLKNSNSKFFRILRNFTSVTRFLITGTPLQNNLKELWSLLNFLLPSIFANWQQFESWFDFSDLQDEEGTEEFLQDQMKHNLVKKIHLILQPLLLRRIKADVEHLLPKKREYILFAPMTRQQTDLYNIISDESADTRKYLEDILIQHMTNTSNYPSPFCKSTSQPLGNKDFGIGNVICDEVSKKKRGRPPKSVISSNPFEIMMGKKSVPSKHVPSRKRKIQESISMPTSKSVKTNKCSMMVSDARDRRAKKKTSFHEGLSSDEDELSDDAFEEKIAKEIAEANKEPINQKTEEEIEQDRIIKTAKLEIGYKKLGNPVMQLRLTCNSPHNFHNPWLIKPDLKVDETIVTSSGKMLLLDRLLSALFVRGSKVLIFSQFRTQLDILELYSEKLRKWKVCRIDGTSSQEDRREQIEIFNKDPKHKLFLLSTRAGGQGINLTSADTVIIFDSDWNPQQDLQAQDRAHRIGQKRPVIIYRLATRGTIEEDLLFSANAKRRLEKLVIKKGDFKSMTLKTDSDASLPEEALKALLLKDGMVYQHKGGEEILSDADLEILCDRSAKAYDQAANGLGDSKSFRIVETKPGAFITNISNKNCDRNSTTGPS